MTEVISIKFRGRGKSYYFDPAGVTAVPGEQLVVETAKGMELGECCEGNHKVDSGRVVQPLRPVIRKATEDDLRVASINREREKEAMTICAEKIAKHGLEMKLVDVECSFEGNKILFFFTADGRVDFRELVKDLAGVFRTRIELRQIGARDEAKMLGGLGICGRPFCCASFLDDFQPVSIKMAKTQNLSLNPTKISGTCGRLMCCLKYEQEAYEDLIRTAPKMDSFVDTPEGRGTVVDVNLLRQQVKVRMEDAPETISTFKNVDIAVLRSGKAKKNDPPIPADLAPISGSGKRVRKEREESEPVLLDPIRFRYSTEAVVEEQEEVQAEEMTEETKEPREGKSRSRRRRKPKGDQPKAEPAPKAEQPKQEAPKKETPKKEAAPKAEGEEGEDAHKKSRRRNHRRYRKPKSGGEGQNNG